MEKLFKTLFISFFIISFFTVSSVIAADVAKIGVFDYQRFIENSKAGQKIRKKLTDKKNEFESKLKKKAGEIEKLREQLSKEAIVMSPEKQEEKKREYRIKINDYKALENSYTKEIKTIEFQETKKLLGQLKELIDKIGKDENFLMIVHEKAVLYYPNQLDITDRIIKKHNKKFGKNG